MYIHSAVNFFYVHNVTNLTNQDGFCPKSNFTLRQKSFLSYKKIYVEIAFALSVILL
jgi:hypothetical protein